MDIMSLILLCLAVSLDSFIAGVTYGTRNIAVPINSLFILGLVTLVCCTVPMFIGRFIGNVIEPSVAIISGSTILLLIGFYNIFHQYLLKILQANSLDERRNLTLKMGRVIICIMADPEYVDFDHSKSISPQEALFLGFALGLDNMAAIFGACLIGVLPAQTPILMALIQMGLVFLGIRIAGFLSLDNLTIRWPYLPGAILVLMALLRLVK